jgi:hypothetical protein
MRKLTDQELDWLFNNGKGRAFDFGSPLRKIFLILLVFLCFTSSLHAAGAVRITLTSTSAEAASQQGVARDATRFFTSASATNLRLSIWGVNGSDLPDIAGGELAGRVCTSDAPGAIQQISGIYFHDVDGMLYVTANNFPSLNSYLIKYDPNDLGSGPLASWTLTSQTVEGVLWNAAAGTWWVFYHSMTDIEERDTNFTLLATKTLPVVPGGTEFWNGGIWVGDKLYLNPHNQNTDDRIYIYQYSAGAFVFVNRVAQPLVGAGQGMFLYLGDLFMVNRLTATTGNIIKCAFNPEPAKTSLLSVLVEWWALNEASGNALGSRAGKDLTETSGTIAQAAGPGGVGNSRDFEAGDTEHFTRADAALNMNGNQDFTVAAFVNLESIPATNFGVVSKYNSGASQAGYLLYKSAVNKFQFAVSPDGTGVAGNAKEAIWASIATTATWYCVFGEHDAGADTIRINVDSTAAAPVVVTGYTGGVFASTADFQIGAFAAGANNHDGLIAKVALFNRVLTDAEKDWLRNAGVGRTYAEVVAAAGAGSKGIGFGMGTFISDLRERRIQ